MKPKFPEEPISRVLPGPISAKLMYDGDKYSSGSIGFLLTSAEAFIDDKTVGSIGADPSGSIWIHIGKQTWTIKASDLFSAVYQLNQSYSKE